MHLRQSKEGPMRIEAECGYSDIFAADVERMVISVAHKLEPLFKKPSICQHKGNCLQHCFEGSARAFALTYTMKAFLSVVGLLLNLKRLKSSPLRLLIEALINKDNLRFAMLPTSFTAIAKATLCLIRKTLGRDDPLIAGFIGGFFSLLTVQRDSRTTWSLFLLARSVDVVYTSLCNRGIIKKRGIYPALLFGICNMFIGAYAWPGMPYGVPNGINKFFDQSATLTPNELVMIPIWRHQFHKHKGLDITPLLSYHGKYPSKQ
eukprot:TRINITY_DN5070_c0_g1_i1.p1 TRINITY_DN5070_c0_g1~~TRINITY_DN5070_c0_g1_i1.p1  ORF type:complete len:262 (+),score=29.88 TRINITY_DN5070_c0_g1_i1:46-831(+)